MFLTEKENKPAEIDRFFPTEDTWKVNGRKTLSSEPLLQNLFDSNTAQHNVLTNEMVTY